LLAHAVAPNDLPADTDPVWPMLLVLSDEGPNLNTAGGILLYRLLSDYPADRLRVIERNADSRRGILNCSYRSIAAPLQRFETTRFHVLKHSLCAMGVIPRISMLAVARCLENFVPQVVLSVMSSAAYYEGAYRYARAVDLPLVLIVHDVGEEFEQTYTFAAQSARRRDAAIYRYAAHRLCVSPEMEELNTALYGVSGEVMYPNRSENLRPRQPEQAATLKLPGRLSVGYVGNLSYGYGNELLRLLPAFRATGSQLVIFGHPPRGACRALLDARDCCDFRGFVRSDEAWRRIKNECDAVILPYSHEDGRMARLYQHHFPSKLPEYLALGMPLIVTGPAYATGVEWALRHCDAVVCYCGTDLGAVSSILASLRDDPERRLMLANAAIAASAGDFDPIKIKGTFLQKLRIAAGGSIESVEH
jgi:glycosyltransferase involved in cell wall biosynthesis